MFDSVTKAELKTELQTLVTKAELKTELQILELKVGQDLRMIDGRLSHLEGMVRLGLWGLPVLLTIITAVATTVNIWLSHR